MDVRGKMVKLLDIIIQPGQKTLGFLKSKSGLNVKHDITSDDVISVMIPKEDV